MAEGTPSGSHFGIDSSASEGAPDPLSDDYEAQVAAEASPPAGETPPESQTPAQEEPATPQEQTPAPAEQEPAQGEETPAEPAGETPQQQQERLYAGRYSTTEDLEAGYKHLQALQKRTAESIPELQAKAARADQLEGYLRKVAPMLQQMQQRQAVQQVPDDFDANDPAQLQAIIDQQVQQRLATERQTISQQTEQQMELQRRQQVLTSFAAAHPEVMGTEVEDEIATIVATLDAPIVPETLEVGLELAQNPRLRQMVDDLYVDPTDPNMLQAAKEAVENPALAEIYLAQPDLATTPHGQAWARKQAQLPQLVTQAQVEAQNGQPTPEQQRLAATVETGGSGVPVHGAPGATPPGDEFDEAARAWQQDNSYFGFGGR